MRIGLLAYATDTGLGNQTYEFYKHMNPEKVLVADLSKWNQMPLHNDWYYQSRVSNGYPTDQDMEWLVDGMDVVFVCETPLNYHLFKYAKERGVTTIQQYNYEFLDYFRNSILPKPTVLAAPSTWNTDIVRDNNWARVMDLPVPINRDRIPFRKIDKCKTFMHIIGRPAERDRNGTLQFIEAARRLGNAFNYIIYVQPPNDDRSKQNYIPIGEAIREAQQYINLKVVENTEKYEDMYKEGDVLVLPRKYGGLCLPQQEALSAGIPVIMTDISPNIKRLPMEWLCPAQFIDKLYTHTHIDLYQANPKDLMVKMIQFASNEFMRTANQQASTIAEKLSWVNMKDEYLKLFEAAMNP